MNTSKLISVCIALVSFMSVNYAQEPKKTYQTKFVEEHPVIDGFLDDTAWQGMPIATDFVMFSPGSGTPEPENLRTDVKVVYDDEAIYIGAYLHDDEPETIPIEFKMRDEFGNADFFGIALNPQNDGINQTEFFVMSSGNQNDAKVNSYGNEDWSWNAVWDSAVRFVDDGWIVEMKIPYAALRFSNDDVQTWGVNFYRNHQRTREKYSWNFIPKDKGSVSQYDGVLKGISRIKPPIRLSLLPYVSGAVGYYNKNYNKAYSAGMDLKYGITESFTLDATLIPDFGQTAYDNRVLNLSAYEQKYSEKRSFFTEGLDLFSKHNFFYSRRVGSTPTDYYNIQVDDDEEIVENPSDVSLYNAIKVSGRTKNGLGIGVFNAVTKKTEARIVKRNEQGEIVSERTVVTEPLANYNVLVFDQQFNKNSSISFINTDVLRAGSFRDANVSALLFRVKTKDNKYGIFGGTGMSNIMKSDGISTGFEGRIGLGKVSGKHQFDIEYNFVDKRYDKNDLGYLRKNNVANVEASYSYRIFKPRGDFNRFGMYFWMESGFIYEPYKDSPAYQYKYTKYTGTWFGANFWATTKEQLSFGGNVNFGIGNQYDYDEPRSQGRFYKSNPNIGFNSWFSTDYRKAFALDAGAFMSKMWNGDEFFDSFSVSPRYRINNHITLHYSLRFSHGNHEKGYVTQNEDGIIFGDRKSMSVVNSFRTKYNFSTKSSLGVNVRHYWAPVAYGNQFYSLNLDGTLSYVDYSENENFNYNIWNFDVNYAWEFAPGSLLTIQYRNNSVQDFSKDMELNFFKNIRSVFDKPLSNQLSFKLIYYLDYNQIF